MASPEIPSLGFPHLSNSNWQQLLTIQFHQDSLAHITGFLRRWSHYCDRRSCGSCLESGCVLTRRRNDISCYPGKWPLSNRRWGHSINLSSRNIYTRVKFIRCKTMSPSCRSWNFGCNALTRVPGWVPRSNTVTAPQSRFFCFQELACTTSN